MRFVAEQPDAKRRQLFDECRDARLVERMRVADDKRGMEFRRQRPGGAAPPGRRRNSPSG
jgi:hypothetical protein